MDLERFEEGIRSRKSSDEVVRFLEDVGYHVERIEQEKLGIGLSSVGKPAARLCNTYSVSDEEDSYTLEIDEVIAGQIKDISYE